MSKILVADNDIQTRTFCYDALTQQGYRVLTCPINAKLPELIIAEKPDLVLFDIQAVEEKGRVFDTKIPTVVFTSKVTAELEKNAYGAGAIDVISKEIEAPEFCARIEKILKAKHLLFGDVPTIQNIKLLIVDDESEIRDFLVDFFEQKGLRTFQAANGEEAILLVKNEKPSAVLLDITMPGMDGIVALKKIREIDPKVNVVMVTGNHEEALIKQAMTLGAFAYVLKPFDLQYLELVVLSRLKMAGAAGA